MKRVLKRTVQRSSCCGATLFHIHKGYGTCNKCLQRKKINTLYRTKSVYQPYSGVVGKKYKYKPVVEKVENP